MHATRQAAPAASDRYGRNLTLGLLFLAALTWANVLRYVL